MGRNSLLVVVLSAILASCLFVALGIEPIIAEPNTIIVPDDYSTIQGAIGAASPGDTIYVRAGTYFEWIDVTESLSLIGESMDTTIIESPDPDHGHGIDLYANNVTVTGFTIKNYDTGMYVSSNYNTIEGNTLSNDDDNIFFYRDSKNNTISNNVMSDGVYGLYLDDSCDYTVITNNTIFNNEFGLDIRWSHGATLRDNNMTDNEGNFRVRGSNLNEFTHDIDTSNTMNGKPIYYWMNQHNRSVPSNAGCVYVINSTNILVEDLNLTNNANAVKFVQTNNSVIRNVHFSENSYNIVLVMGSVMNVAKENTITGGAISLGSSNNTITNNTISEGKGVIVSGGASNNVTYNTISECSYGILISGSYHFISDNNLTNSGIYVWGSSTRNTISGNVISNTGTRGYGIRIEESSENILTNNTLTGEAINFGVYTDTGESSFSHFIQHVDSSNTVNGKPIYYWMNEENRQIPSDAGYVAVVNSTNITVKDLNLTCNGQGILFARTTNSLIENVNVSWNEYGIFLFESSGNTVNDSVMHRNGPRSGWTGYCGGLWLESSSNSVLTSNTITRGYLGLRLIYSNSNVITENMIEYTECGICLTYSSDSVIYHNNFINNTVQLSWYYSPNIWDNGCEGNFWSHYNGTDLDGDGIGDTELPCHGDFYPLMNLYWHIADVNHDLKVNIFDVVSVCSAYLSTPSDPNWNPHCDITEPYGTIDIFDVVTICESYGEEWN